MNTLINIVTTFFGAYFPTQQPSMGNNTSTTTVPLKNLEEGYATRSSEESSGSDSSETEEDDERIEDSFAPKTKKNRSLKKVLAQPTIDNGSKYHSGGNHHHHRQKAEKEASKIEDLKRDLANIKVTSMGMHERIFLIMNGKYSCYLVHIDSNFGTTLQIHSRTSWKDQHPQLPFFRPLQELDKLFGKRTHPRHHLILLYLAAVCETELRQYTAQGNLREKLEQSVELWRISGSPTEINFLGEKHTIPTDTPAILASQQTRLESMLPAPVDSSTRLPVLVRDTMTRRQLPQEDAIISIPSFPSDMPRQRRQIPSEPNNDDDDSGDGKIHKKRYHNKQRAAIEEQRRQELHERIKNSPHLRRFMELPPLKQREIVEEFRRRNSYVRPRFQNTRSSFMSNPDVIVRPDRTRHTDDDDESSSSMSFDIDDIKRLLWPDSDTSSASSNSDEDDASYDTQHHYIVDQLAVLLAAQLSITENNVRAWFNFEYIQRQRDWMFVPLHVGSSLLLLPTLQGSVVPTESPVNSVHK